LGYVGNKPALNYTTFAVQHFTTSATTGYTLDHAVTNENDIRLVINNVVQQPGGSYAYTATGTTLTLSVATAGTDTMYCVFIGKAVQTVNPGADSVGTSQLADESVNEAKLKVSNSPSNGQVLSAQSGAAGGLTWAADAAGTVTGYTNGVDNRVITSSGTTTLNGEANLTYDGTQLVLTDGTEGTDNLLVKTTADGSISMAVEKSDLKYDLGLDHNNDGSKNFFIRERTKDGVTTNSLRLIIDEAGAVTKPLQPGFKITQTGALSVADGHTLFSSNTTEVKDIGSNWASGTFTAPVDGFYYISASILYESLGSGDTDTIEDTFVMSNGNEIISRGGKLNNALSSGGYFMSNNATTTYMDASDTCICQHSDGGTLAVHNNAHASHFEGYLLG
jgi:hypothetical protein